MIEGKPRGLYVLKHGKSSGKEDGDLGCRGVL